MLTWFMFVDLQAQKTLLILSVRKHVMALVQCKECNGQVSDSAKTCPHCGATIKNKSKSKSSFVALVKTLIIVFCGVFIISMIVNWGDVTSMVEREAKEAVSLRLRDASSAEFGTIRVIKNEEESDGVAFYSACGTVNAKNSFNSYVGFQQFISTHAAKDGNVGSGVVILESDGKTVFESVWSKKCTSM
ncbi:zinc ribbon domain-containing protein [Serratia fonticola]|uniref:zinc ribbon domain-containing protein n=1 Tax=Serratia fonticola TaxID=47917 RepID=UPI00192BB591|nr:zinc ribbon domain-containing protein [Serratia fonticola]MBL5859538.1 zinc ribbon domain-containing protein [Serratia fonticola]